MGSFVNKEVIISYCYNINNCICYNCSRNIHKIAENLKCPGIRLSAIKIGAHVDEVHSVFAKTTPHCQMFAILMFL